MTAPEPYYSCTACGATVRRCFSPSDGWNGWQHVSLAESDACYAQVQDRWEPRMSVATGPIQ